MQSQVLHQSFYSPALQQEKKYCIYLPPTYYQNEAKRYSTLYLLPGLMDYERSWCDHGRIHEHMDNLIYSGRTGEMIVVMPDKEYPMCLDIQGADPFAIYLGVDLVEYIDGRYRTISHRSHRGIEGLSLGAGWALRMILDFPNLYCSVSCLSGGYSQEHRKMFSQRKEYLQKEGTRFRVAAGRDEPEFVDNSREFAQFLRDIGFYCEFSLDDGPHEWSLWTKQVYHSLQFHYYSFNPS